MSNTFKAAMRLRDLKAKTFLQIHCADGDAIFTTEVAKKLFSKWKFAGSVDFSWKDKETQRASIGLFYSGNNIKSGLVENFDVAAYKKAGDCMFMHKDYAWRVIFEPSKTLQVGYDYKFDFKGSPSTASFAFKSKVCDDVHLKGRIDNDGHVDTVVKAEVSKDWSIFYSQGFLAKALGGKGETSFGIGVRGEF